MNIGIYCPEIDKKLYPGSNILKIIDVINQRFPLSTISVIGHEAASHTASLPVQADFYPVKTFARLNHWLFKQMIHKLVKEKKISLMVWGVAEPPFPSTVPYLLMIQEANELKIDHVKKWKHPLAIITATLYQKNIIAGWMPALKEKVYTSEQWFSEGKKDYTFEEKQSFKSIFTEGKEYFICLDTSWEQEKWRTLFRAFSVFKKMQQSSWKLMVVDYFNGGNRSHQSLFDTIATYKYREDVIIYRPSSTEELRTAIASSYLGISLTGNSFPIAEAIRLQLPVIAAEVSGHTELANMVIPIPSVKSELLANEMMTMYKNENLYYQYRSQLTLTDLNDGIEHFLDQIELVRHQDH